MMMNDESVIIHCLVAMLLSMTWHLIQVSKNEVGVRGCELTWASMHDPHCGW